MQINTTDYAWAAGIIDGEGCISLNKENSGTSIALRVCVVNTDLLMLKRLLEIFGVGSIHPMKRYKTNHRPAWMWDVKCRKAAIVLEAVLPYLVSKRKQAEVGLYSRTLLATRGTRTNPNIEELGNLKTELSRLKKVSSIG